MTRTSISHPLRIDYVSPATTGGMPAGRIGMTFCPGKQQAHAATGTWKRDLALDIAAIRDSGAAVVVTLVEPHELIDLGVPNLGAEVRRQHMDWLHLPIADVSVPTDAFEQAWHAVGEGLRSRLRNGFDVIVHCKGGLGRAGMIAARLLVELGIPAQEAIAKIRAARPGAIETKAQERYVHGIASAPEPIPTTTPDALQDRALGALLGLAVGDALGTTLEFKARDSYDPLTTIVGGGPFRLKPGQWTDDTAMALALADSLIADPELDQDDLMQRFDRWQRSGAYSCTETCFDIGIAVSSALARWRRTGEAAAGSADPRTAGNGALMRLAPVALRWAHDPARLVEVAARQTVTTHAALAAIMDGSWHGKRRDEIQSSGYVAHSLEAAIWATARTTSYRDAVLLAANLGGDADTTAAITGQLAGAIYGASGIPQDWLDMLEWREKITSLADCLTQEPSGRTTSVHSDHLVQAPA